MTQPTTPLTDQILKLFRQRQEEYIRNNPPAAGASSVKSGSRIAGQVVTVSIDEPFVRSKEDVRRELAFREARFHGLQRRR